jgi:hypothetical protein
MFTKRRTPRTAFKKGHPPIPGSGRPKGSKNRFTREVKEALINAFNTAGGEAWLVQLASKDRRAFASLLSKLLPNQVTGKDGGPLEHQVTMLQAGLAHLTPKELETFQALMNKATETVKQDGARHQLMVEPSFLEKETA